MRRTVYILISLLLLQLFTIVMPAPAIAAIDSLRLTSTLESVKFDVNDISFLWPVPNNSGDADALITAAELTADGSSQIWPKAAFDAVIETAKTVGVDDPNGTARTISFEDGDLRNTFDQQETWKVVGMRIDPSAPGSSSHMINALGSVPQIRLIMQPVTTDSAGRVAVHDYTAHLVYNFTKGSRRPAVPDKEKFAEIVNDLKRLKANLAASGISTDGKRLGVHPGLEGRNGQRFSNELKTFIKNHVTAESLAGVSFMGLEPPEPWIFFGMEKKSDGSLVQFSVPTLGSNKAQMILFNEENKSVFPEPATKNLEKGKGVSTAMLFGKDVRNKLASPVFADQPRPRFREIPDVIANPERSHFFNTDCASCHSESARRHSLNIRTGDALFKYQIPEGISSVNTNLLPTNDWNVRNFGWFPNFFTSFNNPALRDTTATVTMRTVNETAEAVEFINQEYLINTPVNNVVAKDNDIGGANLRRQPSQLSALSQDDFCVLKPGESVGIDEIESVGNGFAKVNIAIPNTACPSFKEDAFIFQKHFDLAPITKTVAKRIEINGVEGANLRRRPLQLSKLTEEEFCLLKPNQSIGVNAVQAVRDGFTKVNVIVPSPTCPSFKGDVFVFDKHFNFD